MRTSLTEIQQIENWLLARPDDSDRLVFEARMLTSPLLNINTRIQRKLMDLVKLHHRKMMKTELECMHIGIFCDESKAEFIFSIKDLFNNKKL